MVAITEKSAPEAEAETRDLEAELGWRIAGEVRFDE
jgi:hypothetical protein